MFPEKLPLANTPYYMSKSFFGEELTFWAVSYVMENYSLDMHAQEWTEVNIVINGTGMHYLGDRKFPLSKGDTFIVPPNVFHGYVCGKALNVYHVGIHPLFFQEYLKELESLPLYFELFEIEPAMRIQGAHQMYLSLTEVEFTKIESILNLLCSIRKDNGSAKLVLSSGLSLVFIAMLCDIYSNRSLDLPKSINNDANFIRSIAYIYENYSKKITIDKLCSIANRSKNSYISIFQKYMKKTPGKFILEYRLEQAYNLVLQTGMTITNISQSTGFYDLAHFLHNFRNKYGTTPAQLRKTK